MYFNDVHILYYVIAAIAGLFVGQIVDWSNKRYQNIKKFFQEISLQNIKWNLNLIIY